MTQYYEIDSTIPVDYYRTERGTFYMVCRMTKSCTSIMHTIHTIYTFDDMIKCINDPDNVIGYCLYVTPNANRISRFYSKNWFVEINKNQVKITM